jgi:hypothetical protein
VINIKDKKKPFKGLIFEDEISNSNSFNIIRNEFHKKWIKRSSGILISIIILIIHFTVIYPQYLISDSSTGITVVKASNFSNSINWTIISIGVFSILYSFNLIIKKYTPSLREYIKYEINSLGLKIHKKRKSILIFLLLSCFSIPLLLLLDLNIIQLNNLLAKILFRLFMYIFLFLCISVPVLWSFLYDGLTVKLKGNYEIFIYPNHKFRRIKRKESKLVEIYMISNKIALNLKNSKRELYSKIAGARWLPRIKKFKIFKFRLNLYLRFSEFSTPINLQKKLLNLILALQEWDLQLNSVT